MRFYETNSGEIFNGILPVDPSVGINFTPPKGPASAFIAYKFFFIQMYLLLAFLIFYCYRPFDSERFYVSLSTFYSVLFIIV